MKTGDLFTINADIYVWDCQSMAGSQAVGSFRHEDVGIAMFIKNYNSEMSRVLINGRDCAMYTTQMRML